MTYEELVQKLRDAYKDCDASKINEHLAIQFNIQGEAEGALYLEIKDGSIHIEPYEYYDRDILVTVSAADLIALAEGNADILAAYNDGKLSAEGNLQKGLLLNDIVRPQAAEEAAKKEAEEAAKKEAEAKVAKEAEEAAKKEAEAKAAKEAEEAAKKEAEAKAAKEAEEAAKKEAEVKAAKEAEEAAKKEAEAKAAKEAEEAAKKEAEAKAAKEVEEAAKKEAEIKETVTATKPAVKPTGMSRKKNRKRRK